MLTTLMIKLFFNADSTKKHQSLIITILSVLSYIQSIHNQSPPFTVNHCI